MGNLKTSICTAIVSNLFCGRFGGVVVSVLVTGPKGRGFNPGRGDGL
jgi:hypothetical protein